MIGVLISTAPKLVTGILFISESLGTHVMSFESGFYSHILKDNCPPPGKDSPETAQLKCNRYFVQRQSTQPPSGSYSGRGLKNWSHFDRSQIEAPAFLL